MSRSRASGVWSLLYTSHSLVISSAKSALSGTGVRCVVDGSEALARDVGVDLGAADVGVSEEFLLDAQPSAADVDVVLAQRARLAGSQARVVQQLDQREIAPRFRARFAGLDSSFGPREHAPDLVALENTRQSRPRFRQREQLGRV